MIPVEQAQSLIADAIRPLHAVPVPLAEAVHGVLAEPARARFDLPRFTQSAVDGYAVCHADLAHLPVQLPLTGHIAAAAQAAVPQLTPGQAMRVLTGGMVPHGADTVVRQEKTRVDGSTLTVLEGVNPHEDVRDQGEECAEGSVVAETGTAVTAGLIGTLATAGIDSVTIRRPPRVVVLTTGDEVVTDGSALHLGQIPDANGPQLAARLAAWGMAPLRVEHVPDREDAVRDALERAFLDADIVLSTGGVSVGDHDYIPGAAEAIGARRVLWKVAQKPGMPLYVAERQGRLLFGLPGNPASVLVNLLVYVRPAALRLQGLEAPRLWSRLARLSGKPPKPEARKVRWLRGVVSYDELGICHFEALGGQASHMLGNLVRANALGWLPAGDAAPGTLRWLPLDA